MLALFLLGVGAALGIWLHGTGAQAASRLGPVLIPPASCAQRPPASRTPQLCISQPYGDPNTVYILHGSGFAPNALVTLALDGVHVLPAQVRIDEGGRFNYAVDQGHHFFAGPIPTGTYSAVVTAPGGGSATATFRVYREGSVPPLPTPPGPPTG